MDQVHLKMNESKTEFIYFGWPSQLDKLFSKQTVTTFGFAEPKIDILKQLRQ